MCNLIITHLIIIQKYMEDRKPARNSCLRKSAYFQRCNKNVTFQFNKHFPQKNYSYQQAITQNLSFQQWIQLVKNTFNWKNNDITEKQRFKLFFLEIYKGVLYSKKLKKQLSLEFISKNLVVLPQNCQNNCKKKFLLLGLDQTLIYLRKQSKQAKENIIDHGIKGSGLKQLNCVIRPHLHTFLQNMQKLFHIFIFSSSTQEYIRQLLNKLNIDQYVEGYLSRKNCFTTKKGFIIKDLRVIANRQIKDIVLVDKATISFSMQLNNGIPIQPFLGQKGDKELYRVQELLQQLSNCQDVTTILRNRLKLQKIMNIPQIEITQFFKS